MTKLRHICGRLADDLLDRMIDAAIDAYRAGIFEWTPAALYVMALIVLWWRVSHAG